MITKAFKYRIYPTRKQEELLQQTLTTCRFLYNTALDQRISTYKETQQTITYNQQANNLSKNKNEYQQQVHSQVLQDTLKRLDTSYQNFFRRIKQKNSGKKIKVGFPRFKSTNRFTSFCYPQSGFKLSCNNTRIYLSKIGYIKLIYSRDIQGTPKTCRIKKDVDQWYIIITCDIPHNDIIDLTDTNNHIGIDVGISSYIATSKKTTVPNPRNLQKSEKKLKRQQRWLSRKVLGSNNRNEQRIKVAKTHRQIRRQREDFLHKLSFNIVKNNKFIFVEKLNIRGMLKNHCLAKHISDASWHKFIGMLTYKAESARGLIIPVNARGTSQICVCGAKVEKTLSDRVHICSECGHKEDRDIVSAEVVEQRGMDMLEYICRAGTVQTYQSVKTLINAYGDLTSGNMHAGVVKLGLKK